MGGEEERSERWEIREKRGKGEGEGYERGQRGGEGENIGKGKLVFWMKAGAYLGLRILKTGTCMRAHIMFGSVDSLWLLT